MEQWEKILALRSVYRGWQIEKSIRLLLAYQFLIGKEFDLDKECIDLANRRCESLFLANKDKLKSRKKFPQKDQKRLSKAINTMNKILTAHGYAVKRLPYLEFDDEVGTYPIDVKLVGK